MWGTAPDEIWAVGRWGHALRYDGAEWISFDTGFAAASLNDVWASGPNDVWITGMNIIQRFDGTQWHLIDWTGYETTKNFRVWGSGPSDVWVVADAHPSIQKYNPAQERVEPVRDVLVWRAFDISGTSSDDVWITGDYDVLQLGPSGWVHHAKTWGDPQVNLPFEFDLGPSVKTRALRQDAVWLLGTGTASGAFDGREWSRVGELGLFGDLATRTGDSRLWGFRGDRYVILDGNRVDEHMVEGGASVADVVATAALRTSMPSSTPTRQMLVPECTTPPWLDAPASPRVVSITGVSAGASAAGRAGPTLASRPASSWRQPRTPA